MSFPKAADRLLMRKQQCERRLSAFGGKLEASPMFARWPHLCVYAHGSYGRLEASDTSDLDLFIVDTTPENGPSPMGDDQIKSELIRIAAEMGFPAFDKQGEFLVVHSLSQLLSQLGSPQDEALNSQTARLLLLLESKSLYNPTAYRSAIEQVTQTYYRHYPDHETDFQPQMLVNDIMKYFLGLFMQQDGREWQQSAGPVSSYRRAKNRIKRIKLQFSCRISCFSLIIPLHSNLGISPADLIHLTALTPLERLSRVAEFARVRTPYRRVEAPYMRFLEEIYAPGISERILDDAYYNDFRQRAEEFRQVVIDLTYRVSKRKNLDFVF